MLLSIDRVLQLLSEGKTVEKIAEMAECESGDVTALISEARSLLSKYEKTFSRRKIVIKKKQKNVIEPETENGMLKELLKGAELSAIPVNVPITMNISGFSDGDPGNSGIGIIIYDQDERQVGKVSEYVGMRTGLGSEFAALKKGMRLAGYFQASELKIRSDSEMLLRILSPEYKTRENDVLKQLREYTELKEKLKVVRVEHIARAFNDKAVYLAELAVKKVQEKRGR